MQIRPILLLALALANLAGCQSYFPNGYGNSGPYSAFPPAGYGPPPGSVGPSTTYQPGRTPPRGQVTTEGPPLKNNNVPSNGLNNVPNPREPGAPATLGTPADELGEETIRRPTSSLERAPARLNGLTDESEERLAAFGDDDFPAPRQIESAAGDDDGDDMPRTAKKPKSSPYRRDPEGNYAWLMGTVSRDPDGNGWRLKYSDDPLDDDKFGGILTLVGDDKLELLRENEVIRVYGRADPTLKDSFGKATYQVDTLQWMKRKNQ